MALDWHPVNQSGKLVQRRMLTAINGKTELFLANAPTDVPYDSLNPLFALRES
ncbi:hypothetical protein [Rhizobium mongolense]|uniref:hypothetical protein n=1 Tax=Rhizobium mongolense TaxID=57676 RepID=UPI0034A27513